MKQPITPDPVAAERGGPSVAFRPEKPASGHGCAPMRLDLYDNSDFDRGATKLKEALWVICKCLFFLNPFPWPSFLRVGLLRLFGARLGHGVVIRSGVNITFPWRFSAGDHVWIGEEVHILSLAPVILGSHVCISQRAFLCTGSHDWKAVTFDLKTFPITVEDHVWISAHAFLGPNTHIGSRSVIGAGAVVLSNVPANSLVRGNPATVSS
jgi:putative colanic acid biosynthesis acetyltransferase WcaF